MKKFFILTIAVLLCSTTSQGRQAWENGWKEKLQSEKIAFLTMEMDITPQEAQIFWPVYNQIEKEKDAALQEVIKTHKALAAAVESNNAAQIPACLDSYLLAQNKLREIESKAGDEYKKALPVEKAAKLYIAEEKFRRQHIRKLHENKPSGPTQAPSGK